MTDISAQFIDREHQVIYQTYKRLPVVIDRAQGCRVFSKDGVAYLDMLSGIAVNALGHGHPRILQAIDQQSRRYLHVSNFFYQDTQIRLAEMLTQRSGFSKVVFTNSGAEAWDTAMKLARAHGSLNNRVGDVIGFRGGFHGRTYGALSVMDKPLYKNGMDPFLPGTRVLPFNDVEALHDAVNATTCAIGIECIQGEGGIMEASAELVAALQSLREKHGFVIIADEVQTGVGRTGDFFAFEKTGLVPDIVTMAKGVGGGLPLGAVLASEALSHTWKQGQHGSTYGGNALACATGMVVMEELANGLQDHVRSIGAYLHAQLEAILGSFPEYIKEVRGRGLMLGLRLCEDSTLLRDALIDNGVITSATATDVLRIVPPFIIDTADVDEFIVALKKCVQQRMIEREA